jgi:transcriptional regulator with XRE-family HTH domain
MNTNPIIVNEIRRLSQEEGLKDQEIAEIIHYNRVTISKIRKENDIPAYNKNVREKNKIKLSKSSKASYNRELELVTKLSNKDKIIESLKKENEKLKREIEAAYGIDYDTSEIPVLKRRIYDLEEMYDQVTNTLVVLTASMSSVRYTEYEKQESEDV